MKRNDTPVCQKSMFEIRHRDKWIYVLRVEMAEAIERKLNEAREELDAAYAELRKIYPAAGAFFDKNVHDKATKGRQ